MHNFFFAPVARVIFVKSDGLSRFYIVGIIVVFGNGECFLVCWLFCEFVGVLCNQTC